MFYLDVAYVLQWFSSVFHVFLQVFKVHVSSVSSTFRRMLQVSHLDVSKVDRVLHLSLRFLLPRLGSPPPGASWHPPPLPLFSMLVTFEAVQAPCECAKRRGWYEKWLHARASGRPSASMPEASSIHVF
jgi:hypothetical protein